jgi:hypothetical protein
MTSALKTLQASAIVAAMSLTSSFAGAMEPKTDQHKNIPKCPPKQVLEFNMPHIQNDPLSTFTDEVRMEQAQASEIRIRTYQWCYDATA